MAQALENAKNTLSNAVASLPGREALSAGVANASAKAQATVDSVKGSINSQLSDFSSKNIMNASSEFLNSNSIVAKFAFLVLLLIVFMFLLKLGVMVVSYFMSPSKQPYLVKGVLQGSIPATIPQDPANAKSPVVYRSNNQTGGVEFTWCVWVLINSLSPTPKLNCHIFNKGNNTYDTTSTTDANKYGLATVNNGPGLYLGVDSNGRPTNSLRFVMDAQVTTDVPAPVEIVLSNVPMQKWFHVAYRFQNYTMDAYVNGVLASSKQFDNYVPKQNYDDIYLGQNGGFSGAISNLRYYDYALPPFDIAAIVGYGPNLTPSNIGTPQTNSMYDYIALSWYSTF